MSATKICCAPQAKWTRWVIIQCDAAQCGPTQSSKSLTGVSQILKTHLQTAALDLAGSQLVVLHPPAAPHRDSQHSGHGGEAQQEGALPQLEGHAKESLPEARPRTVLPAQTQVCRADAGSQLLAK